MWNFYLPSTSLSSGDHQQRQRSSVALAQALSLPFQTPSTATIAPTRYSASRARSDPSQFQFQKIDPILYYPLLECELL
ncbi:MAG: hypothetical protein EZS28_026198 [Streblomastix strix]|uniref:Uncharacterized protein n=1 Tax=Streblomastix strix TaxID=222440 RepID=A0A5J4V7U5_9EUKA|nr:MAG: hypothetical protein EZS28_026198 [Streblomastix strix]